MGIDPAVTVEIWEIDRVTPYARNAKVHDEARVAELAGMIEEFGWTYPLLVDEDGVILAGHKRRLACLKLGLKQLPVIVKRGLSEAQKKAYRIADNKTTENSGWDDDLLKIELADLKAMDFDLGLTGFDADELADFFGGGETPGEDTEAQIDRAEELREKWQVETGQLWQLDDHRLICGDCTDAAVVERVMGGEKADLLLADPPYGELKIFNRAGAVGNAGDNLAVVKNYGAYEGEGDFELSPLLNVLNGMYTKSIIWGGNYFTDILPVVGSWLIWDKRAAEEGHNLFYADCELAWSDLGITAQVFRFIWQGMIRQGEERSRYHPTQKPVELYEWCIGLVENCLVVLDPTHGSGSTLIACDNLGRRCRAVEISPGYVAVALERWAEHTGRTPVLIEGD